MPGKDICEDINPYILMTRLGLKVLAHYKMIHNLIYLLEVVRKETQYGDQARS